MNTFTYTVTATPAATGKTFNKTQSLTGSTDVTFSLAALSGYDVTTTQKMNKVIVDFDWEDSLQTTKSMRKYIHIIPSIEQSLLDYGVAGANYNANMFNDETAATYLQKSEDKEPKLGINEEYKLFQKSTDQLFAGKKEYFKIRLTSKKTGKKCDIKFS